MAQFDVHANLGRNRRSVPLLLLIQSARFDYLRTRLVMPLVVPSIAELREGKLIVEIDDLPYAMLPYELFAVPLRGLGVLRGSLSYDDTRIIQAIDDIITTAYY